MLKIFKSDLNNIQRKKSGLLQTRKKRTVSKHHKKSKNLIQTTGKQDTK